MTPEEQIAALEEATDYLDKKIAVGNTIYFPDMARDILAPMFAKIAALEAENAGIVGKNTALLWCCHVRGPDDLYAARDYTHAVAMADDLNAAIARGETHEYDPVIIAHPMIWPWDPDGHAEDLKRVEAAEATRQAKPAALRKEAMTTKLRPGKAAAIADCNAAIRKRRRAARSRTAIDGAEHADHRAPLFYTPVDGWKPDRPMMEECDFPTFEEAIAYSDAWFYWAVNRDEMI